MKIFYENLIHRKISKKKIWAVSSCLFLSLAKFSGCFFPISQRNKLKKAEAFPRESMKIFFSQKKEKFFDIRGKAFWLIFWSIAKEIFNFRMKKVGSL